MTLAIGVSCSLDRPSDLVRDISSRDFPHDLWAAYLQRWVLRGRHVTCDCSAALVHRKSSVARDECHGFHGRRRNPIRVSAKANATLAISPVLMLIVWCMLVWKADDEFKASLPRSLSDLASRRYTATGILELCGMASYTIYLLHKPLAYIVIEKAGLLKLVSSTTTLALVTALVFMCLVPVFLFCFIVVERNARSVLTRPWFQ